MVSDNISPCYNKKAKTYSAKAEPQKLLSTKIVAIQVNFDVKLFCH